MCCCACYSVGTCAVELSRWKSTSEVWYDLTRQLVNQNDKPPTLIPPTETSINTGRVCDLDVKHIFVRNY